MDGISPERLGNLHLVLLHLPIGFVAAAALLEFWRWRRPSAEGAWLQGRLLGANAVATLLTAGAGLLLAETGGYPEETLGWHRWAGIACAGLAIAAWAAQARGAQGFARGLLVMLLGATVATGHLGATLTHGEAVTAWWRGAEQATAREDGTKTAGAREVKAGEAAGGAGAATQAAGTEARVTGVSEKSIQDIFATSCVECHGPKKVKGRLRLDSREVALAAGRSGRVAITPGKPEESEVLRRVKLPREDDEAMPAGDGPGLSKAEIDALEKWIAAGAAWE